MKNKKGFTLIELLAVIVILAIIALIATPMIMDVIDKARKGAVENSALGYVEGVEKYAVYGMIDNGGYVSVNPGVYVVGEADVTTGSDLYTNILNHVEYKGDLPRSGWVAVDDKGNVVAAYLEFASYKGFIAYTVADHAKADAKYKQDSIAAMTKDSTIEEAKAAVVGLLHPTA